MFNLQLRRREKHQMILQIKKRMSYFLIRKIKINAPRKRRIYQKKIKNRKIYKCWPS